MRKPTCHHEDNEGEVDQDETIGEQAVDQPTLSLPADRLAAPPGPPFKLREMAPPRAADHSDNRQSKLLSPVPLG